MKTGVEYSRDNYKVAIAKQENIEPYIKALMNDDEEIAYLTGSKVQFTDSEVREYYKKCLTDLSRYDFLIFEDDKIIGEVVLNEIDDEVNSAHFRICIFYSEYFNKGIGTFATKAALNFAFVHKKLQRVGLEVFSFNKRAIKMYEKAGFVYEGKLRNAIMDGDKYADIICMSVLLDEYENTL